MKTCKICGKNNAYSKYCKDCAVIFYSISNRYSKEEKIEISKIKLENKAKQPVLIVPVQEVKPSSHYICTNPCEWSDKQQDEAFCLRPDCPYGRRKRVR